MRSATQLSATDLTTLSTQGWATLQTDVTDGAHVKTTLLRLGQVLGLPTGTRTRNLVDELRPTAAHEAHKRSMSNQTGTGLQPWHMDMAHRLDPARYLVMAVSECPEETANTELLYASDLIQAELQEAASSEPFLVRTGARSFYATLTCKTLPFVRFDPGCMQGATTRARRLMKALTGQDLKPAYVHQWKLGSVLIIDNWKMLHRRSDTSRSPGRTLYRVSVMGKPA
jgi:alpha-ketoglutarate-dependent taurine dioxygenase